MPKAKCRICGAQLDTAIAYKVVVKGVNKYFCSETEYRNEETKKQQAIENKNNTYSLMCDILGVNDIVNTSLWKEYNEWLKIADASKINDYLGANKDYLIKVTSRLDNNQFARIRYISAILKNSLADFKPKKIEVITPKLDIDITMYDMSPSPTRKRRRALSELEDEI